MLVTFEEKYRRRDGGAATTDAPAMEALKAAADGHTSEKPKDEYRAFSTQSQPQFDLWIRPNAANASPALSLPYSRRASMTADDNFFVIIVQYDSGPVLSVRLHGRNLEELHMKLLAHEAVYVREFDPRKWPEVPGGEACITGIDVRYRPGPVPKSDEALPGEKKPEPEGTMTH